MTYQKILNEIAPHLNPAGVEAAMRSQYGALCHLPRAIFAEEAKIAEQCEQQCPGYLRDIANSLGMADDFRRWESKWRPR